MHEGYMKHLNVALAIGFHVLVGLAFLLASQFDEFSGGRAAVAALLWFGGLFLQLDWREKSPGGIWLVPILFPFAAWYTELGLLALVGGLIWLATQSRAPTAPPPSPVAIDPREAKLRAVEATALRLEAQLRELLEAPHPLVAAPALAAASATPAPPPPQPAQRSALRAALDRDVEWGDLLGARALAWAGGLVTVLGIVFFFVLAANRGWLGPEIRVALGALTSVTLFAAGFWVRRRFGSLYAAVAAAGAGISGAYATLLAATALYDFVPQRWALVAAAAIAAAGASAALVWRSQTLAGLGLLGAILVPVMVVFEDGELSFVGTAFVALMLAATAAVCLRAGWRDLLLLAGGASLVQIAVLAAQTDDRQRVLWLGTAFWLLFLGIGLAWQLLRGREALEPLAGVFVITGGALASYACLFLLDDPGLGLLAAAAVYAILAVGFYRLDGYRDVSSVLGAVAAAVGALASAELVTGISLTAVWAAVAVLLAWLARKTGEDRLLFPSLTYTLLGVVNALVDAPPRALFDETPHPGSGALAVVASGIALALFAYFARGGARARRSQGKVGQWLDAAVAALRRDFRAYAWPAGALFLYAASLGVLELFVRVADFDRGHVALAALWGSVALALIVAGVRVGCDLEIAGLALLVVTGFEVVAFDSAELGEGIWGTSFLVVAGCAALAGFEYGRRAAFAWRLIPAAACALGGAWLAAAAIDVLATGEWHGISKSGGAFALAALAYGTLAATVFRSHRDLSTVYWSLALALATVSLAELLADFWLVLAGAVGASLLALAGRLLRESRLELAAAAAFTLTGAYALATQAPPSDLFVATAHPGAGALHVLPILGAALLGVFVCTLHELRIGAAWTGGMLLLYAASLGVLELFVRIADFDWGHVALTGLWAAAALAVLEVGLRRARLELQAAAFGLLVVALAELAAFDWVELPSVQAAVGSLVLAGAFVAAGIRVDRRSALELRLLPAAGSVLVGAVLTAVGTTSLADGSWHGIDVQGGALVLAGLAYGALAAKVFDRCRDLATCLWAVGLAFTAAGTATLLSGFWLVVTGALAAVGLHLLAKLFAERRLALAGLAIYVAALLYALAVEAPPREFLVESVHPGSGVPALLVLAAAVGVVVWRPAFHRHAQMGALAVAGAILFYALSLAILEIAELASDADVGTKFQRGHTAVSAFWGLVSLGFLYLGLTRRQRELRIAGFGLFGISLAKLFLYDLTFLSSLTRALSFIAVGAVLLFAGFFYQRLSEQLESRDGAGRPA
jgi:uncharacterized membrane protein